MLLAAESLPLTDQPLVSPAVFSIKVLQCCSAVTAPFAYASSIVQNAFVQLKAHVICIFTSWCQSAVAQHRPEFTEAVCINLCATCVGLTSRPPQQRELLAGLSYLLVMQKQTVTVSFPDTCFNSTLSGIFAGLTSRPPQQRGGPSRYSLAAQADVVLQLCKACGVQHVLLAGHSDGALLALMAAAAASR